MKCLLSEVFPKPMVRIKINFDPMIVNELKLNNGNLKNKNKNETKKGKKRRR